MVADNGNIEDGRLIRGELRSPRAAALAGIGFALLMGASLILVRLSFPGDFLTPAAWLATAAKSLSLAMTLIPFAGIAFLYFMGVVRDHMGSYEDQFFSTLFFGSGYLYLGMTFVAAALAGGVLVILGSESDIASNSAIYTLALTVSNRANSVYAMRMAGTFMSVLGTIWLRTGVMPRWMGVITYLLAALLLISISFTLWLILIFPAWVLMISIAILIQNFRRSREF